MLSLGDWETAERLLRSNAAIVDAGGGALHLMAKRNDAPAVKWLLDHGAAVNGKWAHWDSEVTPLHLAVGGGHTDVALLLLAAGADPDIRDSKHDGDVYGWAEHFRHPELVPLIREHAKKPPLIVRRSARQVFIRPP